MWLVLTHPIIQHKQWLDGPMPALQAEEVQQVTCDTSAAAAAAADQASPVMIETHESLAAARQLATCWEGLKSCWPPPAAQPQELIAAAAAAAYGTQAAATSAAADGPGAGRRSARPHLLGCADVALQWAAAGLPEDAHLIDSAAAMCGVSLLPVMADPEGFGAAWVRHLHRDRADCQVHRPGSELHIDAVWREQVERVTWTRVMTPTQSTYTVCMYKDFSRPVLTVLQVTDVTCEMDVTSAVPAATSGSSVLLCAWDATQLEDMQSLLAASRLITPTEGTTSSCERPLLFRAAFHIVDVSTACIRD